MQSVAYDMLDQTILYYVAYHMPNRARIFIYNP